MSAGIQLANFDLSSRHIQSAVKSIIPYQKIDCQIKCNKINEKIYKALRGEYENQGVYVDDY